MSSLRGSSSQFRSRTQVLPGNFFTLGEGVGEVASGLLFWCLLSPLKLFPTLRNVSGNDFPSRSISCHFLPCILQAIGPYHSLFFSFIHSLKLCKNQQETHCSDWSLSVPLAFLLSALWEFEDSDQTSLLGLCRPSGIVWPRDPAVPLTGRLACRRVGGAVGGHRILLSLRLQ